MFNPIWGFDFKVTIDNHVVAMSPGQQIAIPVRLELIRGKPQQVDLDVNTRWESVGLTATIRFSGLAPSQPWEATMMIKASANTPPGSYLFTVRGSAKGTFHTSEDAVTVIVEPEGKQKLDKQNNYQIKQPSESAEPSFDLSKLFTSTPKVLPYEAIKEGSSSIWPLFFVLISIAIAGGLLLAAILKSTSDGGGGGGGFNCPTSCGATGVGVHVPKSCKCPAACPYTYIKDIGGGYKECANIPPR